MTKKFLAPLLILLSVSLVVTAFTDDNFSTDFKSDTNKDSVTLSANVMPYQDVYDTLHLQSLQLTKQAFDLALQGFQKLLLSGKIKNPDILTIVDFSQPSTTKRMYIIDLKNRKLLEHSLVSHGRNTGQLMATSFSNRPESFQSSLGFYVTSETYSGKHGLSLRLDGMEKDINDNARERAIVIHGADYASENFCKSTGYLGRSYGCPAVPSNVSKAIINLLRDGSCLFIYFPDKNYRKNSSLI